MVISQDVEVILIGFGIGFVSSILGAMLQYWFSRRSEKTETTRFPGFVFLISGLLGLIGLCVIVISFFSGWTRYAVYTGVGVISGFFVGFVVMLILWSLLAAKMKR